MTDEDIIYVGIETLILLIERMTVHELYDPDCDCVTHYCQCEHEGFITAVGYIKDCLTGVQ